MKTQKREITQITTTAGNNSNDFIRLYQLNEKTKDDMENKKYRRSQIVLNSKCLKDKPKFKNFFAVIKPEVSYDLLPLDLKMQRRLNSMEPAQKERKSEEELIGKTNKIGHLCSKRTKKFEYIKKVRHALEKLMGKLSDSQ